MLGWLVIDNVRPRTPNGYSPKAAVGERVAVTADIFRDGHDILGARVRWRPEVSPGWSVAPLAHVGNDRWEGFIEPTAVGSHRFVIEAWTDRFATWRHDIEIKVGAGQDVSTEFEEGARFIEALIDGAAPRDQPRLRGVAAVLRDTTASRGDRLNAGLDDYVASLLAGVPDATDLTSTDARPLWVDRALGRVGAWYELFPRSEGGFEGAMKRLPAIAEMGFDIVYLPPVHPIGTTFRKGPDNTLTPDEHDVGSPWAIGGAEGGHTAVHPDLGTIEDFGRFMAEAADHGLEVALDYALQCSPDHPWVSEHPEWFHHRPDGTIRYAENPPKKYQDIYPINFWPPDEAARVALWGACKAILDHWIDHGVRVFRVDNPHTKPFAFWEWMLAAVRAEHPDVLFLAEAFTRPKVMARLAEVGFTQSYTYFTWRTARRELEEYLVELGRGPTADYMRPNFWPNTPDILSGPLRNGPPSAFMSRLVLAATMGPSYGIYSGYELGENEPASDTNEEYLHSEKYELRARDWDAPSSLAPLIARLNDTRRRHPALAELRTIRFHTIDSPHMIAYSKTAPVGDAAPSDVVLVVVNLDPYSWHEGTLSLDLGVLGLPDGVLFEAHDELTGATFGWTGPHQYVRLDPALPAHVLHLRPPAAAANR